MDVVFATEALARTCTDDGRMRRRWGSEGAERVATRLAQLAAALTTTDIVDIALR